MPRYSRRRTYRSRARKSRFSKYNIYKNRSSRSQASQIYQLNKKINRIEAKTKPEFKTGRKDALFEIETPNIRQAGLWGHSLKMITGSDGVDLHNEAIQQGLFCRLCGLTIWGNIERIDVNASHTAGFMRLIVFQYRNTRDVGVSMPDIFSGYNETTMNSSILKEPFKDHINASLKILANRVYKVNNNDITNIPFRITIPGRKLLNFAENSTESIAKGDILMCAIIGQDKETSSSAYRIKGSCKLCYTDA